MNYPASFDFANSVPAGAADAASRVEWMHLAYVQNGMVAQAAEFVASRL